MAESTDRDRRGPWQRRQDSLANVAELRAEQEAKRPKALTRCTIATVAIHANTSLSENAPVDRGHREQRLRCHLPFGHSGPAHRTTLPDGRPYEFPREPGEVWS